MQNSSVVPYGTMPLANTANAMFFDEGQFNHAQRIANVFAKSTMVPDHFKNNIGNVLIAMNYAQRINADIFAVLQNMFVIHGKPGIEAKLVIALVNQCGRFEPLEFEADADGCLAFAKEIKSGKTLKGPKVTWAMVKAEGWLGKTGSKWQTMPDVMFRYRSAAFFARTYCPEVLLGMQTKEELEDTYVDMTPGHNGSYSIKEKSEQKVVELKERLAAAREANPAEDAPPPSGTPEPTPAEDPAPPPESYDFDEGPRDPIREEFINLRSAGYSTWVHKNKSRIPTFSAKIQAEIRAKWSKMYDGITFPLDKNQNEVPQTNGNNGPYLPCPVTQTRKSVKVCQQCDKAEKCQIYQEHVWQSDPQQVEGAQE